MAKAPEWEPLLVLGRSDEARSLSEPRRHRREWFGAFRLSGGRSLRDSRPSIGAWTLYGIGLLPSTKPTRRLLSEPNEGHPTPHCTFLQQSQELAYEFLQVGGIVGG